MCARAILEDTMLCLTLVFVSMIIKIYESLKIQIESNLIYFFKSIACSLTHSREREREQEDVSYR